MNNQQAIDRLVKHLEYGWSEPTVEAIDMGIHALKESRWIPCSEKLPEVNIPVLAQWGIYYSGENRIEILCLNDLGRWHGDLGEPNGKVIAWMPLPEPYKQNDEGDEE